MQHLRDLRKGFAIEQYHILAVNTTCSIECRHLDIHCRIERRRCSHLTIHHPFERSQHRQQRIYRRDQFDQTSHLNLLHLQIKSSCDILFTARCIEAGQLHRTGIGHRLQIVQLQTAVVYNQAAGQSAQRQIGIHPVFDIQIHIDIDISRNHNQ